jgi:hypothetical protein
MLFLSDYKVNTLGECALLQECMSSTRDILGEELTSALAYAWEHNQVLNEAGQDSLLSKVETWMSEASRIAIGYKRAKDDTILWTLVITGCGLFLSLMMGTTAITITGVVLVYVGIIGSVIGIIMGLLNLLETLQDFISKREEYKVEGSALRQQLDAVRPKIKDPELSAKIASLSSKLGSMF